ncbi:ABC transporter substrate-binding protein (plasmid) [Azospirillum baldaniorum]|uniref:Branched-chain amino-acid ABC transporter, periplasmic component n=1 Tax=Azospirillum baldaniorum TaxID=1064539 RepID=A0A9P1NNG3_9PROT|nr:ABC transporter substrate-binding protein [Azospirillum baldaniorum]AWJ91511.1 ABC transporter substrate-binding protein [Azospirillum baldaniorum]TWA70806.1 amino acid/amide ABC transporter substrate-binding protein (HAAT family) [Azospirillum baldaniorum]TWA83630.1 amino acid/amide ABC transporter substrate-binding protein (HAAT family) [Azospirillum brasilense]CCC99820.1 putative branched-chain amino-acid ABC transporter, periplasmic component [Azospirillum baldaniorum]
MGRSVQDSALSGISRRTVLKAGAAAAAFATVPVAASSILRAQTPAVKIGILQPVTGALAHDGDLGRLGAEMAINEINAAGGIKSLGGAKIEMVFGDARSTPEAGTQEVERMQAEGVCAIVGGFASPICLAASQAAARYDLPYLVDVGVSDQIMARGLTNTFRFSPGFGKVTQVALDNLTKINELAGKPAKTVVLVHEDGLFGSGLAKLLQTELPKRGFEILETIAHPTPARDMSNVALRIRSLNPDLVIPSNYYGEFVLLARTMQQQRIKPKGVYAVLGGAASNGRFVKEFPQAAQNVIDCNHWHDPKNPQALALRKAVEAQGKSFAYNVPLNYSNVLLLADAIERAASADRKTIIEALNGSTFAGHIMPYGPTKFVNGQNEGATPINTQIQGEDIKVIFPEFFAEAKANYPAA